MKLSNNRAACWSNTRAACWATARRRVLEGMEDRRWPRGLRSETTRGLSGTELELEVGQLGSAETSDSDVEAESGKR